MNLNQGPLLMDASTFVDYLSKNLPHVTVTKANDTSAQYTLEVAPNLLITLLSEEMFLFFDIQLGKKPPTADKEVFLQWLAGANYLRQGTGNAYLCLTPKTNIIHLKSSAPSDTPLIHLKDHLEMFCNYAEYWKQTLTNYK
ncbi:hypothetical protein COB21_03045 [Candidatus Aerophobetes bacterium]|uniref:Molecular chaperone Tir n=1 Tax=Aerophobetes bacterium TaxID=2030807 RepID=A0A2A4X4R4_UNCAE|nr:MAG: hypothetical protein COB21_03045 [Candidatus Aerophobetes bacterium]